MGTPINPMSPAVIINGSKLGINDIYIVLGHVGIFRKLVDEAKLEKSAEDNLFEAVQRKAFDRNGRASVHQVRFFGLHGCADTECALWHVGFPCSNNPHYAGRGPQEKKIQKSPAAASSVPF